MTENSPHVGNNCGLILNANKLIIMSLYLLITTISLCVINQTSNKMYLDASVNG